MAEEDLANPQGYSSTNLLSDDIISRVYEGGFKTWECSIDLARYLSRLVKTSQLVLSGRQVHFVEVWYLSAYDYYWIWSRSSVLTLSPLAGRRYSTTNGNHHEVLSRIS